jgi:hypothetical protein
MNVPLSMAMALLAWYLNIRSAPRASLRRHGSGNRTTWTAPVGVSAPRGASCFYVSFSNFSSTWIRWQVIALSCRPQRPVHHLAVETVRGPEGREPVGQVRDPVHALTSVQRFGRVRTIALELLGVQIGHFSNLSTRTLRALASFSRAVSVGSWRPVSSRAR